MVGDGGTVLCLLCLLVKNPGRSAPYKGRGRAMGQLTCGAANGRCEAGWRAWGSGPPPEEGHTEGRKRLETAQGIYSQSGVYRLAQIQGVYSLFSLFPSLLNFPPRKKRIGKLSLVCPGAWAGSQESRRQAHLAASPPAGAGEEGGRGLRPASLTFTLISGKN